MTTYYLQYIKCMDFTIYPKLLQPTQSLDELILVTREKELLDFCL